MVNTKAFLRNKGVKGGSSKSKSSSSTSSDSTLKLAGVRQIWGNPFDGTQDVTGNMLTNNGIYSYGIINNGSMDPLSYMTFYPTQSVEQLSYEYKNRVWTEWRDGDHVTYVSPYGLKADRLSSYIANFEVWQPESGTGIVEANMDVKGAVSAPMGKIDSFQANDIDTQDLTVRGDAHFFNLVIDEVKHAGGTIMLSAASLKIDGYDRNVRTINATTGYGSGQYHAYRIYQKRKDDLNIVEDQWEVGDQIYCQATNADPSAARNGYYVRNGKNIAFWHRAFWTYVVGHGYEDQVTLTLPDGTVTKEDCIYVDVAYEYSTGTGWQKCGIGTVDPHIGDSCALCGSTIESRQAVIVMCAYENLDENFEAPYIIQYDGINDFSWNGKAVTVLSKGENIFTGSLTVTDGQTTTGGGKTVEDIIDEKLKPQFLHVAYATFENGDTTKIPKEFQRVSNNTVISDESRYTHVGICVNDQSDDSNLTFNSYTWFSKTTNFDTEDLSMAPKLNPILEQLTCNGAFVECRLYYEVLNHENMLGLPNEDRGLRCQFYCKNGATFGAYKTLHGQAVSADGTPTTVSNYYQQLVGTHNRYWYLEMTSESGRMVQDRYDVLVNQGNGQEVDYAVVTLYDKNGECTDSRTIPLVFSNNYIFQAYNGLLSAVSSYKLAYDFAVDTYNRWSSSYSYTMNVIRQTYDAIYTTIQTIEGSQGGGPSGGSGSSASEGEYVTWSYLAEYASKVQQTDRSISTIVSKHSTYLTSYRKDIDDNDTYHSKLWRTVKNTYTYCLQTFDRVIQNINSITTSSQPTESGGQLEISETAWNNLTRTVNSNSLDITSLKTWKSNNEDDLDDLPTYIKKINNLEQTVDGTKSRVSSVESWQTKTIRNLDSYNSSINNLTDRTKTNETDIKNIKRNFNSYVTTTKYSQLEQTVNQIQSQVGSTTSTSSGNTTTNYVTTTQLTQKADSVLLQAKSYVATEVTGSNGKVATLISNLKTAGITIDGTKSRVDFQADKFSFTPSSGGSYFVSKLMMLKTDSINMFKPVNMPTNVSIGSPNSTSGIYVNNSVPQGNYVCGGLGLVTQSSTSISTSTTVTATACSIYVTGSTTQVNLPSGPAGAWWIVVNASGHKVALRSSNGGSIGQEDGKFGSSQSIESGQYACGFLVPKSAAAKGNGNCVPCMIKWGKYQ